MELEVSKIIRMNIPYRTMTSDEMIPYSVQLVLTQS